MLINIQTPSCTGCPTGSVASLDRSRCIACPQGVDSTTGECACPKGSAVIERDSFGQYLPAKQCLTCPDGAYPGPTGPVYACQPCPVNQIYDTNKNPWVCTCNLTQYISAGDACVSIQDSQYVTTNYPINIAKSLTFSFQETLQTNVDGTITIASSDTIDYLYLKSAYNCLKSADPQVNQSCQVLANLCVLQMYDSNNPICKLYSYINGLQPPLQNAE